MTSVDSGVDTGNDSNDSYATIDTQSVHEMALVKSPSFILSVPKTIFNSSEMNRSASSEEQPNSSTDNKDCDDTEDLQFRQPMRKTSTLDLDPPAGLSFVSLQPCHSSARGYKALGDFGERRIRAMRLKYQSRSQFRGSIDGRLLNERRLLRAVALNNVDQVKALLDSGVDYNSADNQRRSPLHLAACRGYHEIVKILLERGANPNQRDGLGNTPLHLAACTNNVAVVTLLLKAGTDVSSIDHYGRSPLQLAQSKLKLLQKNVGRTSDSLVMKVEVQQVIQMMLAYLHKRGQELEAELLETFSSRLTLSNTCEEVETGVRDLLANLSNLSLNMALTDQPSSTEKKQFLGTLQS